MKKYIISFRIKMSVTKCLGLYGYLMKLSVSNSKAFCNTHFNSKGNNKLLHSLLKEFYIF